MFDGTGNPMEYANLFTSYGSISFERLQKIAHTQFWIEVPKGTDLPAGPWTTRKLNPENVDANKNTFYDRVNSKVVAELIQSIFIPEGFA